MKKGLQTLLSLVIIVGICIGFVLMYNPYNKTPAIFGFINQQPTQLIIQSHEEAPIYSENKAYIMLKDQDNEKIYAIESGRQQYEIELKEGSNIMFASKQILQNTFALIILPNGQIFYIPSQSSIEVDALETYNVNTEDTKNEIQDMVEDINKQYESQKKSYLIDQIGGEVMLHPVVNNLIATTLAWGNKYRPTRFSDNLKNYIAFQQYLGISTTKNELPVYPYDEFEKSVSTQLGKGFQKTKFSKWISRFFGE